MAVLTSLPKLAVSDLLPKTRAKTKWKRVRLAVVESAHRIYVAGVEDLSPMGLPRQKRFQFSIEPKVRVCMRSM
jgi:hypothetical protein